MTGEVFTIGYGNRSFEQFRSLLRECSISAIADVRSYPFSKSNPEFTLDSLRESLKRDGISYVFMGQQLGARTKESHCYLGGKVQYDLLASLPSFQVGLDRIESGRLRHSICLLCAEIDPLQCHRCILVARHLAGRGIPVRHIIEGGTIENHQETIDRLLRTLRAEDAWKSSTYEARIEMAYRIQGDRIAFRMQTEPPAQFALWHAGGVE